ncbi:MAG: hypothetical protein ACRDGA_11275, partial [Bacteroidota bacterium]
MPLPLLGLIPAATATIGAAGLLLRRNRSRQQAKPLPVTNRFVTPDAPISVRLPGTPVKPSTQKTIPSGPGSPGAAILAQLRAQQIAALQGGMVGPANLPQFALPENVRQGFAQSLGDTEALFRNAFTAMKEREAQEQALVGQLPGQFENVTQKALAGLQANIDAVIAAGGGADPIQAQMVRESLLPFQQAQELAGAGTAGLIPLFQTGSQQFATERQLSLEQARAQELAAIRNAQLQAELDVSTRQQQLEGEAALQQQRLQAEQLDPERLAALGLGPKPVFG